MLSKLLKLEVVNEIAETAVKLKDFHSLVTVAEKFYYVAYRNIDKYILTAKELPINRKQSESTRKIK